MNTMVEIVNSASLRKLLNDLTVVSGEIISKSGLENCDNDKFHRSCQVLMKTILNELVEREDRTNTD